MQALKKQGWKWAALVAFCCAGTQASASAATLYVSTTGAALPYNPTQAQKDAAYAAMQTETSPARFDSALLVAKTNDTIQFAPGVFNKTNMGMTSGYAVAIINKSNLTLKAKYRAADTTVSQANHSVIQVTSAEKGFSHVFYLQNQNNVTFDGFEISGAPVNNSTDKGQPIGISIEASDYITCLYNVVHDNGGGGICAVATRNSTQVAIDAGDFIVLDHNVIYNNCNYTPYESSGVSILHCKNANVGNSGFHSKVTNNRIYNNIIVDDGTGAGQAHTDGNGIIIDTFSGNNPSAGYVPSYPATGYTDIVGNAIPKTLIENNVVYNNGGCGIHVLKSANVTVRSNSTYNNARDTTFSGDEIDSAFSKDGLYANNIAYGNPNRTTLNVFSVYTNSSYSPTSTSTWRNNTDYNGTTTEKISMGSAVVSNMLNRDPHYFYTPTGDLELGNYSPQAGIDNGSSNTNDYSVTDILGVSRPQNAGIDRGAYERIITGGVAAKPSAPRS